MLIKKLLLGGIFTCLSIPAFAQFQITPEVGMAFYKNGNDKEKATLSPRIGIGVDYFFNQQKNGWGLMSGLYFYQKKDDYTLVWSTYRGKDGYDQDFPTNMYDILKPTEDMTLRKVTTNDTYTRRDYLQLPLLIKYKWKINNTYAVSAAVGGYVSLGISGSHQIDQFTFFVDDKKQKYEHIEHNPYELLVYNRFDAGFSSRVSVYAKRLSVNLNYETNLYRRDMMGHENLISFTLGYTF